MRKIIGKSKFKIKKLPHRTVIDRKEIIDEKTIAEKFNHFFVNIGPNLALKYQCQIHILNNILSMKVQILKEKNFAMKN